MIEVKKSTVSQKSKIANQATISNREKTAVTATQPVTDIYESKEGATLYIDLPGVSKELLEIDVDQNVLTVKGAIELDMPENLEPSYMEIRSGRFERHFTLGEELDSKSIQASFSQGELKLFIPRSEQYKPRKIEVKAV